MKGWKNFLMWEAVPLLMIVGVFGFLAAINWTYETKFFHTVPDTSGWAHVHQGLVLISMAMGFGLMASLILFFVRLANPAGISLGLRLTALTLVTIFFTFPALFIVVLGPAAITMIEQMNGPPR